MKAKKSPHFNRKIPAPTLANQSNSGEKVIMLLNWGVLIALFLINYQAITNKQPIYWSPLINSLTKPSVQSFTKLALLYKELGFTEAGKKQLIFAKNLSPVLGITSEAEETLEKWGAEPQKTVSDYEFWLKLTSMYPDYADGKLNLTANAFQLGKLNEAKLNLQSAILLNPNSLPTKKLLEDLQK